ncbi:MAG: hypothetical protein AB8H79_20255 [Myxococcota bacterium]
MMNLLSAGLVYPESEPFMFNADYYVAVRAPATLGRLTLYRQDVPR